MGSSPSYFHRIKQKPARRLVLFYWHILRNLIQCNAKVRSVAFVKWLNYGICISITTKSHIRIPTIIFKIDNTTIGVLHAMLKRSFAFKIKLSTASGMLANKNNAFPTARILAVLPPSGINRLTINNTNHKSKAPWMQSKKSQFLVFIAIFPFTHIGLRIILTSRL